MKTEDQVCTPEQGEKLKELGVNQESLFYDTHSDWGIMPKSSIDFTGNPTSLYTVAELGVMLLGYGIELPTYDKDKKRWFCPAGIFAQIMSGKFPKRGHKSEAWARAEILIYAIENDYVTIQHVNHKLSEKR